MTPDFNNNNKKITSAKVEVHSFSGAERNVIPESNIQWHYPSKMKRMSQAWWCSLVILVLGEMRQEGWECQSSLSYKANTYDAGHWEFDHSSLSIWPMQTGLSLPPPPLLLPLPFPPPPLLGLWWGRSQRWERQTWKDWE